MSDRTQMALKTWREQLAALGDPRDQSTVRLMQQLDQQRRLLQARIARVTDLADTIARMESKLETTEAEAALLRNAIARGGVERKALRRQLTTTRGHEHTRLERRISALERAIDTLRAGALYDDDTGTVDALLTHAGAQPIRGQSQPSVGRRCLERCEARLLEQRKDLEPYQSALESEVVHAFTAPEAVHATG